MNWKFGKESMVRCPKCGGYRTYVFSFDENTRTGKAECADCGPFDFKKE